MFTADHIDYASTGSFSKIVTDYVAANPLLQPFYSHPVSIAGIKAAIAERKQYNTDRALLVAELEKQYKEIELTEKQKNNIEKLADANTFTITTAHQPNIFTGHLYFIYKIIHAIKLADYLNDEIKGSHFVPVYYMGSEDADLDELGEISISGITYKWNTKQTGAVGRMTVDDALLKLVEAFSGSVTVHPYGNKIIALLKKHYVKGRTIEQSTLGLVNELFAANGLLVVLPDNAAFKAPFIAVAEKELKEQFSYKIVEETKKELDKNYKVQAGGRELNLFYLQDGSRERIEYASGKWSIVNSKQVFDEAGMLQELHSQPERFSPNVILRPVFQEMILPNVAFIGGGGELAYWLELKRLFENLNVPFPVIVLRNSFLLVNSKTSANINKLGITVCDVFKPADDIVSGLALSKTTHQLDLKAEKETLKNLYQQIKKTSVAIDASLAEHTQALHIKALSKLEALEKKMLRAEKRKLTDEKRLIEKIKSSLFPNGLQERVENIIPFYAVYSKELLQGIYEHSLPLQQQFTVLTEKP